MKEKSPPSTNGPTQARPTISTRINKALRQNSTNSADDDVSSISMSMTLSTAAVPKRKSSEKECAAPIMRVHKTSIKITNYIALIFLVYFVGSILFDTLTAENKTVFQAIYFFVITLTTIGYGDLHPHTDYGKMFHSLYLFIGLGLLSGGVSWLVAYVLEERDRDRINEACKKIDSSGDGDRDGVRDQGHGARDGGCSDGTGSTLDLLTAPDTADTLTHTPPPPTLLQRVLHLSPHLNITRLFSSYLLILVNVSVGAVFYAWVVDDMSLVDAIYFSSMTVSTVGYGDITPSSFWSRLFTIFYAIVGTLVTAKALTALNSVFMVYFTKRKEDLMLNRGLHMGTFFDMAKGSDTVSKEQFIIYKLLLMDIVDLKVIQKAEKQFERLDVNGDGELTIQDVQMPGKVRLASRKRTRLRSIAEDVVRRRSSTLTNKYGGEEGEGGENNPFTQPGGRQRGGSLFTDLSDYMDTFQQVVEETEEGEDDEDTLSAC